MSTRVFLDELMKKLFHNAKKKCSAHKEIVCDLEDDESLIVDIKNAALLYASKQLIYNKGNVSVKEIFDKNYEFYINLVNKVVSFYEKNYNDDFISVLKLAEGEEYKYIFFSNAFI